MNIYMISWRRNDYATSLIHANSKKEAKEKAKKEEDYDFEETDDSFPDWDVVDVKKISD